MAVQAYQAKEGSLREICRRFGIKDKKTLRYWIACYNGHKEEFRRPSGAKGALYMTKGKRIIFAIGQMLVSNISVT